MSGTQQFAGKIAVITGGASGIGKAIARQAAARGATVIVADIEQAALDDAAAELGAVAIRADVASLADMHALADAVLARFGRVDIFFSNAGVASTGRIADMRRSDWEWLLGVNVWGAIHGIAAFLPLLRTNPAGGHIAVTASEAGFHATPGIGGYSVTKSAVTAIFETLALELAEDAANIGVTILCPGPVRSRLGDSQRNRPPALAGGAMIDNDLEAMPEGGQLRWIDPDRAADMLMRAILNRDLYAFTHPEMAPLIERRHAAIAAALRSAEA